MHKFLIINPNTKEFVKINQISSVSNYNPFSDFVPLNGHCKGYKSIISMFNGDKLGCFDSPEEINKLLIDF